MIKKSALSGLGVFAAEKLIEGEIIAIWGGAIYSTKELNDLSMEFPEMLTHPVGIADGFFLGPNEPNELDCTDRFNHSCNPNSGIKGQILLIAKKEILPEEEICYDYETTDTSENGNLILDCKCGSKNCRKLISGNSWKDEKFQIANKGFFSYYLEKKILEQNK